MILRSGGRAKPSEVGGGLHQLVSEQDFSRILQVEAACRGRQKKTECGSSVVIVVGVQ
jgi:hypothetical protein